MSVPTTEAFPEAVKRLAGERGISVNQVGYTAFDPATKGTNPDTFRSAMAGRRPVTKVLMEAVAGALGVAPEEFAEYRLAVAREALDERVVGLDHALEVLSQLERATQSRAAAASRRAAQPTPAEQQPARATGRARRSRKGA